MKRYLFGQCNLIIQRSKKADQKHTQKNTALIKLQFRLKNTGFVSFHRIFKMYLPYIATLSSHSLLYLQIQSKSVIMNSLGPAKFVCNNRGSL
jgi:hypothetical protein